MTEAQKALTARVRSLTETQLREVAIETYRRSCKGDADAEIVSDFAIAELAHRLSGAAFTAFCRQLEAA